MIKNNFEAANSEENKTDIDAVKATVLAVDDNNDVLLLTTHTLESYGIQVITASNAVAALDVIQQRQLHLLISDIAMPEKDGYWLIQQVRSLTNPSTRKIPAIAFSGCTEEKAQSKALASGFQTYLQKPSTPKELITEVAKLLGFACKNSLAKVGNYY
ncbi:MAG: response regulator [Komarekiella atlantica HA4396-MV6]|jgi:CheY-like chemotaxis protein|nr:response regulator [Komarekiella atlantica HA4396-MV6]